MKRIVFSLRAPRADERTEIVHPMSMLIRNARLIDEPTVESDPDEPLAFGADPLEILTRRESDDDVDD